MSDGECQCEARTGTFETDEASAELAREAREADLTLSVGPHVRS